MYLPAFPRLAAENRLNRLNTLYKNRNIRHLPEPIAPEPLIAGADENRKGRAEFFCG